MTCEPTCFFNTTYLFQDTSFYTIFCIFCCVFFAYLAVKSSPEPTNSVLKNCVPTQNTDVHDVFFLGDVFGWGTNSGGLRLNFIAVTVHYFAYVRAVNDDFACTV